MSVLDKMALGSQKYHKALQYYLKPAQYRFGIDSLAYISITNDGKLINLHSNLAWLEHCIDKKYYIDDPHMLHPNNIDAGFALWSTYDNEKYTNGLLRDAIENYGLCHGFTYIEKSDDGYRVYAFATNMDNHLVHSRVLNDMENFRKYTTNLKHKISIIEQKLIKHQVDLPNLKGKAYYDQVGILKLSEDNVDIQKDFLQATSLNPSF